MVKTKNNKNYLLLLTSMSGNSLEWYDFALYGYFSSIIATLFFPAHNKNISLMLTFGAFASGFIARPLGGAIFGYIGDKYGRKTALLASISLITLPTTFIGFLPSYHVIGVSAPIILIILRILQGLAVSGELTGSGAFLVESANINRRGFYGSLIMCSTYLGLLIGSGIGVLVTMSCSNAFLIEFAWRIPFILSFFLGIAALLLRLSCQESPMFLKALSKEALVPHPVKTSFSHYFRQMTVIFLMSSVLAVAIYLIIGYFPTFFVSTLNMSLEWSMWISSIGLLALTLTVPIIGRLSDNIDKKVVLGGGAVGLLVFSYPIFYLSTKNGLIYSILSELLLVLFLSPIAATLISMLSDCFPTHVRYTGVSVGYNLSMAIFGGLTPLIAIYLTQRFSTNMAPAYYLMLCSFITLLGLWLFHTKCTKHLVNEV